MNNFTYDENSKKIWIPINGKQIELKFEIKRAYSVMIKLLEYYPNPLPIHDMDDIFNDPNRAYNDLKNGEGYENFIREHKGNKNTMIIELDLEKLISAHLNGNNNNQHLRGTLSMQDKQQLYDSFGGKCNITGIALLRGSTSDNMFMKGLSIPEYDHRRPLFKGGTNDLSNYQLVSREANREKNKICKACSVDNCEHCALAYPEKYNIILGNGQDISTFKVK